MTYSPALLRAELIVIDPMLLKPESTIISRARWRICKESQRGQWAVCSNSARVCRAGKHVSCGWYGIYRPMPALLPKIWQARPCIPLTF